MQTTSLAFLISAFLSFGSTLGQAQSSGHLGFDRNDYPGDQNLTLLHKTFSFAGFWLNNPPGVDHNSWTSKRKVVQDAGFGFLVLFNGRLDHELKNESKAAQLGKSDADSAITAARHEGFPARTIIFLDQEEGGRMLPEQKAYIYAWVDSVNASGFLAGIYCSGIPFRESRTTTVVTAEDIRENAAGRKIVYWVTNDVCPPSLGCTIPDSSIAPTKSGIDFADIWQFAQSPRRKDFALACPNYDRNGSCYPPGGAALNLLVDIDTANSSDPSHGRDR